MAVPRIKEVVSRKGIKREISKARKKLTALEKRTPRDNRHAIHRQLLQLNACESILWDFFFLG